MKDIVFSDFFAYADTTTHWDPMNIPNEVIGEQLNSDNLPHSIVVQPVYKRLGDQHNNDNPVVGFIFNYVAWESYLSNTIKQENMNGVYFVLKNSCNQDFTFRVQDDIVSIYTLPLFLLILEANF